MLGSLCWAQPGTAQTAPSQWLSYDAATKTVTFAVNVDGTPHSAEIIGDTEAMPIQGRPGGQVAQLGDVVAVRGSRLRVET